MTDTDAITPTPFQEAVLRYRGHCNIMNAGGRGSGKSFSMMLDVIDHLAILGPVARPLVLREQWAGLLQLQSELLEMCRIAFGEARRNKSEGTITIPPGGVITFSNVNDEDSYAKHQGKSYTGLFADECGNYPTQAWAFVNRIRSNLRAPPGVRVKLHFTANPHGRAHSILLKEYIGKSPPWTPFEDPSGELWIWTTSTLEDNPHIDRTSYRRQLVAACGNDEALSRAWLEGDWSVLGGSMFAPPFDPAIHIIKTPLRADYLHRVGGDWGTASPATAILLGRLKVDVGPMRYGSIIALDEVDTADPLDLSLGTGAPPQALAEMIKEMCARNGARYPSVVMDDARGLQSETVIQLLRENGISAHKPYRKDRVGQWNLIRQLMSNAVTGDGPGLYITDRCPHLLETLPEAPRGTLRAEDLDPKWNRDHWVDAMAYGITDLWGRRATSGTHVGMT
jgi:hypothetical protein